MSKYSEDLKNTFKDVDAVRKVTRDVISKSGRIALEEYHEANSLEKLKKSIMK